ncbi:hypothetical protein CNBD0160 [Cryptococcus deneoformans B-3501A]|uniref:hypothetical protein n=1 Tax=Cryptococcus deneoformans (strain B-3501A) TaxID=283643 RepID=UPI000042D4C7|nr:hypothetical protein CNBD0160 [Cryptococcus neoformans var. neoformans B-3501A]EAL21548.1 hypothetical protein CNBD0160 [Cryptococcus neoformans var. neoformans B-3501A]
MTKPRQRTVSQRQPKEDEDASLLTTEQEQEIRELREKNQRNNAQSQNALDVGILTCLFIRLLYSSGIQITSHFRSPSPIIPLLALIQLILLPLSLTPHFLPGPLRPYVSSPSNHLLILSVHLTVSIFAILLRNQQAGATLETPALEVGEVARWALPSLVVGGVEMQRRGERTAEERLRLLEGAKYEVKGA